MFSQEQFAKIIFPYFSTAAFLFGIYFTSFAIISVVFCVRGKSHQKTPEEIAKEEWEEEVDEALVYSNATIRVTQKMQKVGPHKIEPVPGSIKVYMKPRQRSSSSTNGIRELSTSASTSTTKSSRKSSIRKTYRSGESRNSDGDVKSDESTENTELKFCPTRPKPRLRNVASFKTLKMKPNHRRPRLRKLSTSSTKTTSREQILPSSASSSVELIQKEVEFKSSILIDQNNYATNIIESLKLLIIEEVYRTRISNPKHQKQQLLSEDETRIGELCVSEMRSKLEGFTKKNNIPWVCYGRVRNEKRWIVDGFENLNDPLANLILSVKIIIEEPISIVLIGCKVNHNISFCSSLTPIPPQMSSEDKIQPFTPTDSNPSQPNFDSFIPSKRSQYSQSSASETPTVEIILPSRNPETTVTSRGSETKKCETPTSFQTPPWQTSPPVAPTPIPTSETTVTTAKSYTPILAPTKTITRNSNTLTTQIATPSTKIIKTKNSRKTLHAKKTQSNDYETKNEQEK